MPARPPAGKAAPARRRAPAGKVAAAEPKPAEPGKAETLLRAGLKALGTVRDDVVKRQSNVIEGLLGIDKFGIRSFEDVFDQRIAGALQRLGVPTAQDLLALRDEIETLRAHLDRLDRPRASSTRKR